MRADARRKMANDGFGEGRVRLWNLLEGWKFAKHFRVVTNC